MVDANQTFIIVGAGLAGAKAAETLRAEGFTGRVILIGDERDHPYERPPLSKGYLLGKEERDSVFVHKPSWYAGADIELHLGQPAVHLDREAKTVRLGDGTLMHYDKLLLATGAEPRRLDIPGTGLAGVHHLRRLAHADLLRKALTSLGRDNGHLLIAGAGWIGLEVAAAARGYGAEVTVVEPLATPLHAVLGPEVGRLFTDLHAEHGVRFHFGARLTEIVGQDGMVMAARTDDGEEHPAHAVLAAIGAAPRTALAETSGLALVDREHGGGIAVDASLRTSDPDVFAVGDVAAAHHPALGTRLRVEHWANALNGGPGRRAGDAGAGGLVRAGAVLLLRPVRRGPGVLRLRPGGRLRPGAGARGRGQAGVHRVLAVGRPGAGRDERERVGRRRTHPGPDQVEGAGGPRATGGSVGSA
ncbi:ferredoxin reductase [Streptomyces sp. C]|nr:ferredoxin reductase [Streptomyces sp. C]